MDGEHDHDHDHNNDHETEERESDEGVKKNPHKHDDRGAADLEKVTDYVEEQELSANAAQSLFSSMSFGKRQSSAAADADQAAQASVKIRKEDVELIVNEMEVSKQAAEKKLRQHNGNVKEALKAMLAV